VNGRVPSSKDDLEAGLQDEKVWSMKAPYCFTVLVFGALSTNVAFAGDRGDRANANTGVHGSGTAAQGEAKPAAEGPQSRAPSRAASDQIGAGTAKDGAGVAPADKSGTHATETSGSRAPTPPNSDAGAATAPAGAFGQPRLATPGNGAKENGSSAPIDTRITVHQGRHAPNSNEVKEIRELKEHLFKTPKTAVAPAIDGAHLTTHNRQQTRPLGTDGAPVRNAVGAVIEHRTTVPLSGPSAPSDANRQGSGLPVPDAQASRERSPGTVSTGDMAKQLSGTLPASNANAVQSGNHPSKTTALAIVTANAPVVNGTGMMRPGSSGGAVGGSAKVVTGAISGSSFRPKHP
jgi:hypothetical protein